jgi:fructose/tagatose bisphosphate aldolase
MWLEIELGITGGEEDGVDNSDADDSDLYTKPEEVAYVYDELMKISDRFTVVAAFGNVHGVYTPGNVKLKPTILRNAYLQGQIGNPDGPGKPNKKFYDPRVWLRAGEVSFVERVEQAFAELNNIDTLSD